jgi:ferritin
MLNKKIEKAFNIQLNNEFYSSYLYLAMAAYLEDKNLKGMAMWQQNKAKEEIIHAMKFYKFINDKAGRVTLFKIETPKIEYNSIQQVFEDGYKHECTITKKIYELASLAEREKDYGSKVFLDWFITEQIEEESTAIEILNKIKLVQADSAALYMLDKELGSVASAGN